MSTRPRVRAPELRGRSWLGTGGRDLSLADLRGRFLLLDFWTSCCVNCLHVLDELRPLEERWAEELVVVGVHSPKFAHEAEPGAVASAVERHGVHHPVLDDPGLETWQAYTARAWPTLVLVDPEGYVVAQYAGEGHVHAIDALLADLAPRHREAGTLQPGGSPYVPPAVEPSTLRFPAAALPAPEGGTGPGAVLVADAGHDSVVLLDADGAEVERWGGMREPQGLCRLPDDVAAEVGWDVVVADTAGHRLHGLQGRPGGAARVLAGDGEAWRSGDGTDRLSTPWDVAWWRDRVWVAMAGTHQLWTLDPRTGAVEVVAGTTNEGLVDGPLRQAWFAQPSRLVPDGDRLWLVDAETSSVRVVEEGAAGQDGQDGQRGRQGLVVRTVVGSGLFDFGFRDGPAGEAALQHPLGLALLPDGSLAVCDTYNGAVRRLDPGVPEGPGGPGRPARVETLATGLAEPSAAHVADGGLLVVESAAHRLVTVPLDGRVEHTEGPVTATRRPATEVAAELHLVVPFTPPPGQSVDDRAGPAAQLLVTATPPALLREGEGRGGDLRRRLVLDPAVGDGVLHVAARAATCDAAPDGRPGEGAACRMHQQDWGVPVRVAAGGAPELRLPLGGTDSA